MVGATGIEPVTPTMSTKGSGVSEAFLVLLGIPKCLKLKRSVFPWSSALPASYSRSLPICFRLKGKQNAQAHQARPGLSNQQHC
jgi:hypothetical protein